MAKAAVFLFLAAVISSRGARAGGGCQLSDIRVSVAETGKVVEGQPEYEVTVDNGCSCPQNGIRVSCPGGVQSVEPVDESKIRAEDGGLCLINDGMPVAKGSPVTFTYAWKEPQDFTVVQATPRC
ncbi:hypothetical protein ABZP36_021981 [Zizania latifolia]